MAGTLEVQNVQVFYNDVIEAVRDVSLRVEGGRVVALLGSNGAGKSTLLKAISAILYPEKGRLIHGTIRFDGVDLSARNADEIVSAGIVHVPEGRRLFPTMTTEENLRLGGHLLGASALGEGLERVYGLFPRLREKRRETAGLLSGGEQQMVAIGRALIGLSILFVEQNARLALAVSEYAYVMENGRIVLDGPSGSLAGNADIREFYLGQASGGARKSLREQKHYKRRKRWLA